SMSESDFFHFSKSKKNEANAEQDVDTGHLYTFKPLVSLTLADGTEYDHEGEVDAVAGQVNRSTGAIFLRATFPNEENILRSGNTGTLKMHVTKKGEIMIPKEAKMEIQNKTFV